jgi:hypothetical protein
MRQRRQRRAADAPLPSRAQALLRGPQKLNTRQPKPS